jgi:hypothetical protein
VIELVMIALVAQTETATTSSSWIIGGTIGVAVGGGGTAFGFGASVGYAIFNAVIPAVRGVLVIGSGLGGELAGTLTLTLPFSWPVLPFVLGEGGYRWSRFARGGIFGGGGGLFLGNPRRTFGIQVGWIFRRWTIEDAPDVDASGPIFGISAAW